MIHEDRTVSIIRSAEDIDSMCAHDYLPSHLVQPFAGADDEAGNPACLPANIIPLRAAG
jgi:hypothetical protein